MKQIIASVALVIIVVSLIFIAFTFRQVEQEQQSMTADLQYRTTVTADDLKESVEPAVVNKYSAASLTRTVNRFVDSERLAGVAVFDSGAEVLATSTAVAVSPDTLRVLAGHAMDEDRAGGQLFTASSTKLFLLAVPLHDDTRVVGAEVLIQNADYIDARITEIWKYNLLRLLVQALLLSVSVVLIIRWLVYLPVKNLVESIQSERMGNGRGGKGIPKSAFFRPLVAEFTKIRDSLFLARVAASEEARLRLEKIDTPWTAERLKEFIKVILKDRKMLVVSNREPYIHTRVKGDITYYEPASGMVTALEPMIEASGGLWVAHGSGDADRETVDAHDKLQVPPDEPKYTLRRIWLSDEEVKGHYYGFSNEGLWPLSHMAHTRPVFRKEDWEQYKRVNGKFAEAVLSEIKKVDKPIVFIQDYLFALLPRMIKNSRPDAQVCIFWHVPWPNSEAFSICPWRKELLSGMLGADLIGFHTQLHCNNFIETTGRELEALIDFERFSVTKNNHTSFIKPFPISVAAGSDQYSAADVAAGEDSGKKALKELGIKSEFLALGVDRLDYTKGILERLWALETFFEKYPSFISRLTLLQIAPGSRDRVPAYQKFSQEVEKEVERVNNRFRTGDWQPIVFLKKHHSHRELYSFYGLADLCLVTSLHDGMNLVAKEYVASREDEQGVLILSQFAGASRELDEALIVNPYNIELVADTIHRALTMPASEQRRRMKNLRETVTNNNVYRWAADILKTLINLD